MQMRRRSTTTSSHLFCEKKKNRDAYLINYLLLFVFLHDSPPGLTFRTV